MRIVHTYYLIFDESKLFLESDLPSLLADGVTVSACNTRAIRISGNSIVLVFAVRKLGRLVLFLRKWTDIH